MDERQIARFLNGGRILVGAASVLFPGFVGRRWVGEGGTSTEAKLLARTFGVRDLALGLGTIQALGAGEPAARWLRMGVLSDGVDAAATVLALGGIGWRRGLPVLGTAVGAALAGAAIADAVD
jgi:hypothetical protein